MTCHDFCMLVNRLAHVQIDYCIPIFNPLKHISNFNALALL